MNDLFTNSGPGAVATTPRPESNGKPDAGKANTKTPVSEIEYPHASMSLFASGFAKEPVETTDLAMLVRDIRDGKWRKQIERLREILEHGGKDAYDAEKPNLPCVSLSGQITGLRKGAPGEGRFMHSGFLQGDFDAKDHPDLDVDEMLEILRDDPHVECAFRSPSNLGAKAVIRIEPDLERHRDSFGAAKVHFAAKGLTIDESTKDPNRLCFVSFDPEVALRKYGDDAIALPPAAPEPKPVPRPEPRPAKAPEPFQHREENKEATVRALLAYIPARPGYPDWILISSAVWNEIGEAGTPLLLGWSPEEKPGEYSAKFPERLTEPGMGALVNIAKRHGYAPEYRHRAESSGDVGPDAGDIPASVFPVPAGGISFTKCARIIFPAMAEKKRLFMRDRVIHEIVTSRGEADFLAPVTPERFVNLVEGFGRRVARREIKPGGGDITWRGTTFPLASAKALLASDVAGDTLPRISQLVNCPVLTKEGTKLSRGYHDHCGGTYIGRGDDPPEVPLKPAIEALETLLADFAFTTPSDRARALASLLSPALKSGGWIDDDFPLDVAEADQSQSGKTYRQTLVARLYGERAVSIAPAKGGVGSLDESISAAMVKGRPFITLANFRGRLDSTILEEATRGSGRVTCRVPFHASTEIETRPFNWQLSTNGAEFTRDIANRSIITRIRKQPEGYVFRTFPEGDLLAHVEANQGFYLGAVFAVLRAWKAHGCPTTRERRHDFQRWCQALDWIVQNILGTPPLLDGHREEQARTANPALQWLRDVALAAKGANQIGRQLSTSDLCSVAEDAGIEFPGNPASREEPAQRAGKILGRLFRETEGRAVSVDRFEVSREQISTLNHAIGEYREKPFYTISESL